VTLIKHKKRIFLFCVYFAASVFLFTCGIEDIYFLPQVRQITSQANTSAEIVLPSLSSYYYAQNYIIYYRIYISDKPILNTIDTSIMGSINPDLERDFNAIFPNTDPTSTTSGIAANILFSSRGYFELALDGININNILTKSGVDVNIEIKFPTAYLGNPELEVNIPPNPIIPPNSAYNLKRSVRLINPMPTDRYFQNTDGLNNVTNANSNNNADVSAHGVQGFAYASMYVVAAGMDPVKFTPIYGKPTHINIFRLPGQLI